MINKLIVSIGTSAFNEENNIQKMLLSVCKQAEDKSFLIKEIIVISDGSTDTTVKKALTIKDKRIKVIKFKKRSGQPYRINRLLRIFSGDFLVLIDSDMILKSQTTIKKLILPFKKNKRLGLVIGNTIPIPAKTFLESAINNYIFARSAFRKEFNYGKTGYGPHGFLGYSRPFTQLLHIPKNILNYDAFSFFSCKAKKFEYDFINNSIAYYKSPRKIKDYINQSTRHLTGGLQLEKYFGSKIVREAFAMPRFILFKIMIYQLFRNPIGYIFLKILNFYSMYQSKKAKNFNVIWAPIISSKKLHISTD